MVRSLESQGRSFAISGRAVNPVPVTVVLIDSFEDGNITEYSGDTSNASVIDETNLSFSAKDGSKVVEVTGGFNQIGSNPGDGLDNYLSKGQQAEWWHRQDSGFNNNSGFTVRVDPNDVDNHIRLRFTHDNNGMKIRDNYAGSNIASANVTLSGDKWYKGRVSLGDGSTDFGGTIGILNDDDINYQLYDSDGTTKLGDITGNTTNGSTNDGIGFKNGNGSGSTYSDFANVTQT